MNDNIDSISMLHLSVLRSEIDILKSRIQPHDTGHLHTTINVLEHSIKELQEGKSPP